MMPDPSIPVKGENYVNIGIASSMGLTIQSDSCRYSDPMEPLFGKPVEVDVRDSLEKAMKILKQKMSKEGILQELKRRRFYEKPSVKRKRKMREARKRLRREMKRRTGHQGR